MHTKQCRMYTSKLFCFKCFTKLLYRVAYQDLATQVIDLKKTCRWLTTTHQNNYFKMYNVFKKARDNKVIFLKVMPYIFIGICKSFANIFDFFSLYILGTSNKKSNWTHYYIPFWRKNSKIMSGIFLDFFWKSLNCARGSLDIFFETGCDYSFHKRLYPKVVPVSDTFFKIFRKILFDNYYKKSI